MHIWLLLPFALAAFAVGLRPGPWRLDSRDEDAEWQEWKRQREEVLDSLHWKVAEARYKLWALTMRLSAPR